MQKQIPDRERLLYDITNSIHHAIDLKEVLRIIVQKIREFLSVDRVKIYQFAVDGSGEVIAEALKPESLPSLLGLHFPATDIPPYARDRFAKARQRVIVDVAAKWKILNSIDGSPSHQNISNDLRYAPVDSCHIQYLLSMGVLSSMSVPIFYQNELWGLLVVHNSEIKHFSEQELQTVQLLCDRLSLEIAQSILLEQTQQQAQHEAFFDRLRYLLESPAKGKEMWQNLLSESVQALGGDGGRLYIAPFSDEEAQLYIVGVQPDRLVPEKNLIWQQLVGLKEEENRDRYFSDRCFLDKFEVLPHCYKLADLVKLDPCLESLAKAFAASSIQSILAIELRGNNQGFGYLCVFRCERQIETLWAGQYCLDPYHQISQRSFAAKCEIQRYTPEWSDNDLKLARRLGIHLYIVMTQRWIEWMKYHQISHDLLTHLPNWMLFDRELAIALINARQQGEILALAVLDLDRFQTINETFSHAGGDYLLQSVTARLQAGLQADREKTNPILLARWHGDRFMLLVSQIDEIENVNCICEKILHIFSTPFYYQGREVYLTASLGIAIAPYDGEVASELLLHAEAAMYQAKQKGKNNYQFYAANISTRDAERLTLEMDLHKALARDEFVLYYQPQVDLIDQKIIGMEALIRWQHPGLGLIVPDRFIPLAEETGLICAIGEWVLRTACLQHRAWRLAGFVPIKMAVNMSARQLQQLDLVSKIAQILCDTQMEPYYLELEITESTAMQEIDRTIDTLRQIEEMGIQIAIDDFGIGYSCLKSLKDFPIHILKIDRSFVQDLATNPSDAAIAKAIVALGQGLNLKVLVEGVETQEQLEFLRSIGCKAAQGYLLSRPLSSTQAVISLLLNRPQTADLPAKQQLGEALQPNLTVVAEEHIAEKIFSSTYLDLSVDKSLAAIQQEMLQKMLEYEHLKEELKQQAKREKLVSEISHKIRQSLNINDILNTTVTEVRHFLQADRVMLYRFDPNWSGEVVVESVAMKCLSILGEKIDDPCFRDNYVKFYRQGRIKAIDDVSQAGLAQCYLNLLALYHVKANLVVPVIYQEKLWGLLIAHQCQRTRQWRQLEISLLSQLATQAAIAIHQGELYSQLEKANQELQQLSVRDGLTQVANRRRFDRYLAQEWQSSMLLQSFLSLILCDVDFFKAFNDSYGHLAGDSCLQEIAKAISNAIERPADLVARYGGEEFAVILPNTRREDAIGLAEKIRQQVKNLAIPHGRSNYQYVTLSLGIACCIPNPKSSVKNLIAAADTALYKAKQEGRDRSIAIDD